MGSNIVMIVDEDTNQVFGLYDITNMEGSMKDYYAGDFDSYDSYEADMLERGAVQVNYDTFKV